MRKLPENYEILGTCVTSGNLFPPEIHPEGVKLKFPYFLISCCMIRNLREIKKKDFLQIKTASFN